MRCGYRWFPDEQRFYVGAGSEDSAAFLKQSDEMQPKGHWVHPDGNFMPHSLVSWRPAEVPSWFERWSRSRKGWRWVWYPTIDGTLEPV